VDSKAANSVANSETIAKGSTNPDNFDCGDGRRYKMDDNAKRTVAKLEGLVDKMPDKQQESFMIELYDDLSSYKLRDCSVEVSMWSRDPKDGKAYIHSATLSARTLIEFALVQLLKQLSVA